MKFNEDRGTGKYHLNAYGDGWIQVNEQRLEQPIILSASVLIEGQLPLHFQELNENDLKTIFVLQASIILIGTGRQQCLPTQKVQQALTMNQTGFEIMSTDAACRTYHVLNAEMRSVAAMLFPT